MRVVAAALLSLLPAIAGAADLRLPAEVVPKAQRLDLELDPRTPDYRGLAEIDVEVKGARNRILLHARKLLVNAPTVETAQAGQKARLEVVDETEGLVALTFDKPVEGAVTLSLPFRAPLHTDLTSLYRVEHQGAAYVFSQFEPLAAREAFPCFDEPRFKLPWTVTITHHPQDKAFFNTNPADSTFEGGLVRVRYRETKPLPTYLLAFVVGPVDVVEGPTLPPTLDRSEPLRIRGLAPRGQGEALHTSLGWAGQIVADQERAFGIGYPYDKLDLVAVPDFAAGAMENAGLVTFRDTMLVVNETSPISHQKGTLEILAHELAHQWFGNLVTMAWWDDLWLNEGFATWFALRTLQRLRPDLDAALELRMTADHATSSDSLTTARRIREPIRNRGDVENAFDDITYAKGAAVLAMFEEFIDRQRGPGTFLRGVTKYLQARRHGTGTTAEFLAALSEVAAQDIAPAFSTFLDQAGVPFVTASCATRPDRPATVTFTSQRFLPVGSEGDPTPRWTFPACVSLPGASGFPPRCVMLEGGRGTLALDTAACPKALHPNADGGGYYRFTMPAGQLKGLAAAIRDMTPGERLSFGAAVRASFATAAIDYADAVSAAGPLAADADAGIAATPLGMLTFARDEVLQVEAARRKVDARIVKLYAPALKTLGLVARPTDTPRQRERRELSFRVLADAGDPEVLAVAVPAGRELFATGTTTKVAEDLWPTALRSAVRAAGLDAATYDTWVAALKKEANPRHRQRLLHALVAARDPALARKALALALDPELKVNEMFAGLGGPASDVATRDLAYDFLEQRWDDVTKRLPEDWRPYLATLYAGDCRPEVAARAEALLKPKLAAIPGLERMLAQTLEGIRLCNAKKTAHGLAIQRTFR